MIDSTRKKANLLFSLALYSYAHADMVKKPFFLTLRATPLRAFFILALVAAVLLCLGQGTKSRAMEPSEVNAASVGRPINTDSALPIPIQPLSIKPKAISVLAFNYAPPGRTESSKTIIHKREWPSVSPPDITRGDTRSTKISITFDGGMGSRQASEILDILKKRKIKTTIFLSGRFIRNNPGITRRIVADGHEVGNHTTTHPHLTELEINGTQKTLPHVTKAFLLDELNTTEQRFFEVTGQHMSPFWRAPYGEINSELRGWAFSAGYLHIGWTYDARSGRSLDSLDWVSDKTSRLYHDPMEIKKKIIDFDKRGGGLGGGIILMHLDTDRGPDRASSILGDILDSLLERGFSLVKISDLIVNQRLVREAQVKKNRFYNRVRLSRKGPDKRKFEIHVRTHS